MTKISISTDPSTLQTKIICDDIKSREFRLIRLSLTSFSNNVQYIESGLIVSWASFRQAIFNLNRIFEENNIDVDFNMLSKDLLIDYADDFKRVNDPNIILNSDDLSSILSKNGFERTLTNEQLRDLRKLISLKHGANFSVPGAGKTTTLLAIFTILKSKGLLTKLVVVSPINAFVSWEEEIEYIFNDDLYFPVRISSENLNNFNFFRNLKNQIFLINYEKLRKDISCLVPFFIQEKIHFVLDESHRIKSGENNLSYQQIIKLSDISIRRDILSGTPMPQSPLDLESQFYFLWRTNLQDVSHYSYFNNHEAPQINKLISSKFVRTTKHELGLKDPIIRYEYIDMGPIQSELYGLFKSELARSLIGMDHSSKEYFRNIGRSVVRLIEAATNPMLLGVEDDYYEDTLEIPQGSEMWDLLRDFSKYEKPKKIELLLQKVAKQIKSDPAKKILIWSYFTRNIILLEKLLQAYNPITIYGAIPTGDEENEKYREARLKKFQNDPDCHILIANPQAAGEGISLHKSCHYAIYLDRNFNAAYYLQSIDRIHRLGLDKSINTIVEILISKNTIDEILINRLNQKTKIMGDVLNDPYLQKLAYDPSDIPVDEMLGLDDQDINEIKEHIFTINNG